MIKLVSSLPATNYGALYYRQLELSKIEALRFNCGNFDAFMILSEGSMVKLMWWIENIAHSHKSLTVNNSDVILTTAASNIGWGPNRTRVSCKLPGNESSIAWVKIIVQRLP